MFQLNHHLELTQPHGSTQPTRKYGSVSSASIDIEISLLLVLLLLVPKPARPHWLAYQHGNTRWSPVKSGWGWILFYCLISFARVPSQPGHTGWLYQRGNTRWSPAESGWGCVLFFILVSFTRVPSHPGHTGRLTNAEIRVGRPPKADGNVCYFTV